MRKMQAEAVRLGLVGFACAAALATTPIAGGQSSKEQTHEAMIGMAQQMADLKPRIELDASAAALYEQLDAAYRSASAKLGGDDPGRVVRSGRRVDGTSAGPGDDGGIAGVNIDPPGCSLVVAGASNLVPVVIADHSTVTSTVTISGQPKWLWGVEVFTNITHSFCNDLDITLTSPSGRVVTLTTDNGGNFNDIFDGTYWDDDHDWTTQVPYASNPRLVTDRAYVADGGVAELVPEEPLNAFRGEDPNGVWTLTVVDDTFIDAGSLNSWSLVTASAPRPGNSVTRTFRNTTPLAIADLATQSRTISVSGMGGFVCDVEVGVNITHSFNGDLEVTLQSPNGRIATLTTNNGGSFNNVFAGTTFSNYASAGGQMPYEDFNQFLTSDRQYVNLVVAPLIAPEESLGIFKATPANGIWRLTIADTAAANVGTLHSWEVTITTCSCDPSCAGDFNGDGAVDVLDLLNVINTWGACP